MCQPQFFRMLSSLLIFLIAFEFHATFCLDTTYVDNVVIYCQNKIQRFTATEDKYVKKSERKPSEPVLFGPPVKELQQAVNVIDRNQWIFECISDMLNENSQQNLEISYVYRNLAKKCKLEQPTTPMCDPLYPYKTINGTCNNLLYPRWGSTLGCFRRLFPANYKGASRVRKSFRGQSRLPEPRSLSLKIVKPWSTKTKEYNTLFVFFGQVIAHDIAEFLFTTVRDKMLDCCANTNGKDQHPQCMPILHQPSDPFYSMQNVSCFTVARVVPCDTCSVGKRLQLSQVSSYIDCSLIYDKTDERAQILRRNDGTGKLVSQHTESGEFLPPDIHKGPRCGDAEKHHYCFKGGDTRTNQHALLAMFQNLLLREHNRLAHKLKILNPHWDEEKLFQEARKILIAEFQVIIYKEFLPVLLGQNLMSKYGLNIGNGNSYDATIDPSISVEFNAAAFRVHSLISGQVLEDEDFEYLKDLYVNVEPLYNDRISSFISKMSNQPAENHDCFLPTDLTHWLYRERTGTYGFDLAAIDVQRGRDVGLPTYPQVIEYMEKRQGTIRNFEDLKQYIVPECLRLLQETYSDARDIDLWLGLICERVPDDMIIGPTGAEIIAEQFQRLKYGDRFYVEHDHSLTDEQRQTLLDASLSKLLCDNTKVGIIQPLAMLFPSDTNFPVICSAIPGVDLEKWKEWGHNSVQ